jgi:hypothetical protein
MSADGDAENATFQPDSEHCIICANEFDEYQHRPAVGPCEHLGPCALCFMRMRLRTNDKSCCLCKADLDR